MSNDFQINTAIQTANFNNSINEFNKAFKANNSSVGEIKDDTNFSEIFNSISNNPLQGSATETLDLRSNSNKIVSPLQNTATTIGNGIMNSLAEISDINRKAETDFETFASGGDISIHDVMISAQKSSLAMQMAIQLRNQAVNAYNELKNISM